MSGLLSHQRAAMILAASFDAEALHQGPNTLGSMAAMMAGAYRRAAAAMEAEMRAECTPPSADRPDTTGTGGRSAPLARR